MTVSSRTKVKAPTSNSTTFSSITERLPTLSDTTVTPRPSKYWSTTAASNSTAIRSITERLPTLSSTTTTARPTTPRSMTATINLKKLKSTLAH